MLKSGATLPATQTSSAIDLLTVLQAFDTPTRQNLQTSLRGLGQGFLGRGPDINQMLTVAPSFYTDTQQISQNILAQPGAAARFAPSAESLAAAYDPVREELATGFAPQAKVLQAFVDRSAKLGQALDAAPPSLQSLRQGLDAATPLLNETAGLARATITLTGPAPAALKQASVLLKDAAPALHLTGPPLQKLADAVPNTLGFLGRLNPVIDPSVTALTNSVQPLAELGRHGCDVLSFARNWRSTLGFGVATSPSGPLVGGEPGLGPMNSLRVVAVRLLSELNADAPQPTLFAAQNEYPAPCQAPGEGTMSSPFGFVRRRFDIIPSKHRSRPLLIGTAVIAVIVVALLSAALRHVPLTPKAGHVVKAEFTAADQVSNRTVVRVGGVEVGRVESVAPGSDPYRTTLVNMRISDDSIHIHADATATVRWRTLLGGLMYIDLQPGSASAPALSGDRISANRTSNQVEFDQVLDPYAGPTAQQQRNVLKGLRYTFADPQGIGQTIQTLSPTLQTVQQGLQPLLGTQTGDLRNLVAATAKTVSGLNNTVGLENLVTGASTTLAVTDAQQQNLGQTIDLSPPSLNSTFTTMRRLRTTLDHLDPLVTNLQPGAIELGPAARAAEPALAQTEAVLRGATPLLRAAGPTFDALKGASDTGVPLMNGFDPTLNRLLAQIIPYLNQRDSGTKLLNYQMIGPFWSDLASAAGEYDSVGYRIRFTVPPNLNSFISQPFATSAKQACDSSSLPSAATRCPQVAQALTKSWFQAPQVKLPKGAAK